MASCKRIEIDVRQGYVLFSRVPCRILKGTHDNSRGIVQELAGCLIYNYYAHDIWLIVANIWHIASGLNV